MTIHNQLSTVYSLQSTHSRNMTEATTVLPNRPQTRQRAYKQPPSLDVPDIDQDAAERKRVLNVLAQRRYRKSLYPAKKK